MPVRRRRSAVAVLTAAVVAGVVLLAGCSSAQPVDPATPAPSGSGSAGASGSPATQWRGGLDPGTSFTPAFTRSLTVPTAVEASDGRVHLAYEQLIGNATGVPLSIDRIEVRDAATRRVLLDKTGEALRRDFTPVSGPRADQNASGPRVLAPSETWVVWLDVAVPDRAAVPARLEHRITGQLRPPGGAPARDVDAVLGTVVTSAVPPPVLRPPVPAGDWFMSEGCCTDDTHHRRGLAPVNGDPLVPQRFAIDFYRLDEQQRAWVGDPSEPGSYFAYRQPVLAAAAGTVVRALDGIPNSRSLPDPPTPPPIEQTVGNHVIVETGPGVFVLYAHLDPGSVRVRVGQQVAAGDELGLIGTSGNSTVPHLHFQILSTPTFFPSDSRPWVFDSYELLGRVPERIWDDDLGLQPTGKLPFEAADPAGGRTDELPLDRTVVRFGGGR